MDGVDGSVEDRIAALGEGLEAFTQEQCDTSLIAEPRDFCEVYEENLEELNAAPDLNTSTALTDDEALEACTASAAWHDEQAATGSVTISVDDVPRARQGLGEDACHLA